MKKLLAILLTLALMLPLCGLAEENAPQATLTTITFRDFNGRALVAEMEEAAETAYRDLLDALRVEVYRQGFTSCELFLNGQSIVDYGVQTRGADVYISGDVLGGTLHLNLDEDMRHIAEILHQWNASQSIYADAGTELSAKEVSESIAQEYENVGALLAKITKNPLITGEMQSEDIANGLLETDWQQAATRLNKILKVTRVESVSNPPEGCESAKNILYFPLSNEQLMKVLCILLDTVEETPAVKAYVDLLNTYRQLVAFAQNQPVEDTDLQTWLRQQTLLVEDAQVAQYVDSSMRLLRVVNNPPRGIGAKTLETARETALREGKSLWEVLLHAGEWPELRKSAPKFEKFTALIQSMARLSEEVPLPEFYETLIQESGYADMLSAKKDNESKSRLENIHELTSSISGYLEHAEEPTLGGFLDEVALYTDLDSVEDTDNCVTLMTMHAAKGLEFPVVFTVGMEEGVFPGYRAIGEEEELEEERRLCYVALTRAKEQLHLTCAAQRMLFGRTSANLPSRFVKEIPEELVEFGGRPRQQPQRELFREEAWREAAEDFSQIARPAPQPRPRPASGGIPRAAYRKPAPKAAPLPQLRKGDMVRHNAFGEGMVLSVQPMGGDALIEVAFDNVGTKRMMLKAAAQFMTTL